MKVMTYGIMRGSSLLGQFSSGLAWILGDKLVTFLETWRPFLCSSLIESEKETRIENANSCLLGKPSSYVWKELKFNRFSKALRKNWALIQNTGKKNERIYLTTQYMCLLRRILYTYDNYKWCIAVCMRLYMCRNT